MTDPGVIISFAFSTLGCPELSLSEILELAHSERVDGLEFRAAPDSIVHTSLSGDEREAIRAALSDAGVKALSVCTYIKVCEPGDDDDVLDSLDDHLRLARDLGASFVRVFPGAGGAGRAGDERAVRRLSSAVGRIADCGVRVLLETHDSHPTGADVAAILSELDRRCPDHGVGVVWDVLHPWRAGEAPHSTFSAIRDRLGYVQIKDAARDGELCLVGRGDLPLAEIAGLLRERPRLWWSLEWERQWHPSLAPLRVALRAARSWYDSGRP